MIKNIDPPHYGASHEEWEHFMSLGITPDLLPVVSNKYSVISPKSTMKDIGKTPSIYNWQKQVTGIPNWTQHKTSETEVTQWKKQPDYGICVQTRTVRALDIDVTEPILAAKITSTITEYFKKVVSVIPPQRGRNNSSKILIALIVRGDIPKRVIRVREKMTVDGQAPESAWLIEFLATGQQFVAAGTHASGARIEWKDKLPDSFPELTIEQFDELWKILEATYGCAPSVTGGIRKRGEYVETKDIIADAIIEKGLDLGTGKDGQLFIECPWKDGHSMDSGIAQTAYFPRGTRGYELGHFKCFHSGCSHRKDEDFEEAMGLHEDMFDALPLSEGDNTFPILDRFKKGQIKSTISNVIKVLMDSKILGERIGKDNYRDEIMFSSEENPPHQWRPFLDTDYTRLRERLETFGFVPVSANMMRDAVHYVASLNPFDSAIEWIERLKWDGKPRIENFLRDYFGAVDNPYNRSVSNYLWTALAARVLKPGIKADMVPVFIGQQGTGKTQGVVEISPSKEFFEEIDLMERDSDISRRIRGKLVIEISELRGLNSRSMENIKAFISKTDESWVPKYQEFAQKYPRRCVFIGTTNQEKFLADTTGNRRWLPVRCGVVDVKAIKRDKLQLWAEAKEIFNKEEVLWQDAQNLAEAVHEQHRVVDVWQERIEEWLDSPDFSDILPRNRFITAKEVLEGALDFNINNVKRGDEMRVTAILHELKFEAKLSNKNGKKTRGWEQPKQPSL